MRNALKNPFTNKEFGTNNWCDVRCETALTPLQ